MGRRTLALLLSLGIFSLGGSAWSDEIPLVHDDGTVGDDILETLLSPGEFPGRVFVHLSTGDEAAYALDSSLSAREPFAELRPDRLAWPEVAGLDFAVEGDHLKLRPASRDVNDDVLDRGFDVRWVFAPIGQQFDDMPHFAVRIVEAEVLETQTGRRLMFWTETPPPPTCKPPAKEGLPDCDFNRLGLETNAMAISPDGQLATVALGGIKPRIEIYDITQTPRLLWQSLIPLDGGGVVETAFSADGKWVVALTGKGHMHRFRSRTGEAHMAIPSSGQAARSVPPGDVIAVGAKNGEVTFWYLGDGTIYWRLPPRDVRGSVDRLAASGDGQRFATLEYSDARTVVRVWGVRHRSILAEIEVDAWAVVDMALDERGETLYVTHEKRGLLRAPVKKEATFIEYGGSGTRCLGRLQWLDAHSVLQCSTAKGEIRIDGKGAQKGELNTGIPSSNWIFAADKNGSRVVAVGGGHLLVWRTDKRDGKNERN